MRFLPHTEDDIREMLEAIGAGSLADLFSHIPSHLKKEAPLRLPPRLSEQELLSHLSALSGSTANSESFISFLGAGCYDHFIPAAVDAISSRSEFLTSYTPYQPEVSQGVLQAIFEYQTLVCQLFEMDVANASMYDGASAAAEAVLMAGRIKRRTKAILSMALHPEYRSVIKTYCHGQMDIQEIGLTKEGLTDLLSLGRLADDTTACVVLQSPNFFGPIERLGEADAIVHRAGALFVMAVAEPISLGLLRPPGSFNADIVVGEGQPLGSPTSFGGPGLGLFATRNAHVRQMPGRIVGQTADKEGKRAFCLTLATREQHIRREKATSNICTNEGLLALRSAVYLSLMGKQGLRRLSEIILDRTELLKKRLKRIPGLSFPFNAPAFNEFVVRMKRSPEKLVTALLKKKIIPGLPLGRYYPEMKDCLLISVTEKNSPEDIEALCKALQ